MKRNIRATLFVAGAVLLAILAWCLVPVGPRFVYHVGAVAVVPDEPLTLRLNYIAPVGRSVNMEVVSLVCDDQTQLAALGSSQRWSWSLRSSRHVDVQVGSAVSVGAAASGVIVRSGGRTALIPLGHIQLTSADADSVARRCTTLVTGYATLPAGSSASFDVGLDKGVRIQRLLPDVSSVATVMTGDQGTPWSITVGSPAGSPLCFVYRPLIVGVDEEQRERTYLGPMIQVLRWSSGD
ncbi:MAG: hypothetical protein ACM3XN_05050 [Chloroflexota bacterium]